MKKEFMIMSILLLFFSFVIVQAGFGDINVDDNNVDKNNTNTDASHVVVENNNEATTLITDIPGSRDKGVAETKYTLYFYGAIGLGLVVFLLVIYFLYRFFAGPSVRWKKPKPLKH